jgi:hypothetical protein
MGSEQDEAGRTDVQSQSPEPPTHRRTAVNNRHGLRCLRCNSPTLLTASHSVRKARAVRLEKNVGTSFATNMQHTVTCNTLYSRRGLFRLFAQPIEGPGGDNAERNLSPVIRN